MEKIDTNVLLERIQVALEKSDVNTALKILESMRLPDQADLFSDLKDDEKMVLLPQMAPADSADLLEEMEDEEAAELVSALSTEKAIPIVDEMEPDKAADLLGDITNEHAASILAGMENPEEVRPLMLHPDDSAGGLMTSEFLALRRRMTAEEAIIAIRNWKPENDDIYRLFVVDGENYLVGSVSLRELITAEPKTNLVDFMDPEVLSVTVGVDQEECARIITRYDLLLLAVVDENRKLIGVITVDDVIDVIEDETTEDIQRFGGAEPLNQAYLSTSTWMISRKRIGWLLLLFVTESLTGTVLRFFENELSSVVALSFFIPLLIGTGGNAGSQTTSTIIRALAVGDIDVSDAIKSLWHELRIGLMLGLGMSIIAYVRALTWGSSPQLAVTVASSIMIIVVWANVLGAVLPLLAGKLKIDPTVVSGPVMSTLVDATGLFIYFSIAKMVIGL
jgi:magnesium transporter